jgi:DNA adenine methylase
MKIVRYVGGKTRINGWVAEHVLKYADRAANYLEPFVGSGAVTVRVAHAFSSMVVADAHEDLILMWKALAGGWQPPDHVSKEEYAALRQSPPSALRGYVGFGASFSGKWFGGYVDTAWDAHWNRRTKPYLQAAKKSLLASVWAFKKSTILHGDYSSHNPGAGCVVYCDPPYVGTLGYAGTAPFDSGAFWRRAQEWVDGGSIVIVSESTAPSAWWPVAERERKGMLRVAVGEENHIRREALWMVR